MNLSIKEMFRSSWAVFQKNVWMFVGATALIGAASFISDNINKNTDGIVEFIVGIVTTVVLWWLYIGFLRMLLTAYAGGQIRFDFLFAEKWPTLLQYIIGAVISGLCVVLTVLIGGGVAALILGGSGVFVGLSMASLSSPAALTSVLTALGPLFFVIVILIVAVLVAALLVQMRLVLMPFLVLDKGARGWHAVKESWHMTKGYTARLVGMGIILAILNLLGVALAFVGLLVTIPLSLISFVFIYREMEKSVQPQVVPAPQI